MVPPHGATPARPLPPEEDSQGQFLLDLDGFEGPIDLLLSLAREQKLDLSRISILALAEQYLAFVERARRGRLDLAADYLVMAAWLAYLKSRLLLPAEETPEDEEEGPSPTQMAEALAWQVRRLEAMQAAAAALFTLPMLGRDVFARPPLADDCEGVAPRVELIPDLTRLLQAYAGLKRREEGRTYSIKTPELMGVEEALAHLRKALGTQPPGTWMNWADLLPAPSPDQTLPLQARAAKAASFVAALTLAKEQAAELQQDAAFAPLKIRTLREVLSLEAD